MQWSEEAIVLSARKFGESGLLVEVFASTKGLYSGMVSGGQSKSKLHIWQAGNIVEVTWRSRLEEQLGNFTGEVIDAVSGKIICEPTKLQAVLSLTSILRKTLIDRQPYEELYGNIRYFLSDTVHSSTAEWMENYVWIELAILQYLGFALDLSSCAVTGRTDSLEYISPKTGRAVTAEGAKGYEEKLLSLPQFIVTGNSASWPELLKALEVTEYFMSKNLFFPHNRKLPEERARYVQVISRFERQEIQKNKIVDFA